MKAKVDPMVIKRRLYYLQEVITLFATAIAVLFAEAYKEMLRRGFATWSSVNLNIPTLILAVMISVITYGAMNSNFKFNEERKPPFLKRLASALLYGFAWQSLISGK